MRKLTIVQSLIAVTLVAAAAFITLSSAGAQPAPVEVDSAKWLDSTLAQAKTQSLERGWLKLVHYRHRGLDGGYLGEAQDSPFYLSPQGRRSPQAELEATLKAMMAPLNGDEAQHAQCRFLARRRWIAAHFGWAGPWLPCQTRTQWLTHLAADSVSIVFAASYMNNPSSLFGHTFFKFHTQNNNEDKDLLNYGVNFAAATAQDQGLAFMWRGVFGFYPGYFSMLPYHQQLKEYTNLDGRDIWEYRLSLSPDQVTFLIEHLLELEQARFAYYFFDQNCAYYLLTALEAARSDWLLTRDTGYFVIPADTIRSLAQTPNAVVERRFKPSLITQFQTSLQGLSHEQQTLVRSLADSRHGLNLANEPLWPTLQRELQAQIVDAALLLAATEMFHHPQDSMLQRRSYELKVLRSSLGSAPPLTFSPPPPPETGHRSSRAALGFGADDRGAYLQLGARLAYHDVLAPDPGYLRHSQLEILGLEGRWLARSGRSQLQKFVLARVLSIEPSDNFFSHLSWSAQAIAERALDKGADATFDPLIGAGVGRSWRVPVAQTTLSALLEAEVQAGGDLETQYRAGLSPRLYLLTHWSSWWRSALSGQWHFYLLGEKGQIPEWSFENSLNPSAQWEFRAHARQSGNVRDFSGWILWYYQI